MIRLGEGDAEGQMMIYKIHLLSYVLDMFIYMTSSWAHNISDFQTHRLNFSLVWVCYLRGMQTRTNVQVQACIKHFAKSQDLIHWVSRLIMFVEVWWYVVWWYVALMWFDCRIRRIEYHVVISILITSMWRRRIMKHSTKLYKWGMWCDWTPSYWTKTAGKKMWLHTNPPLS